ncbi:MAG: DNA alkylation repair protein [Acidobacteria bacterium]|nr:DNA alkylation repair protein [Acidobacteriota bacterium]
MALADVMAELESLGTEQNRKTYSRHGGGANIFGVSFAHLGKIAKRLKKDTPLAEQLWATGNFDARNLATLIADPADISQKTVEAWAKSVNNRSHGDLVAAHVSSKAPFAQQLMEKWRAAKSDHTRQQGWDLVAILAMQQKLTDEQMTAALAEIERDIDTAPNWTRHAMNGALISIGIASDQHHAQVLQIAARIGKVEVDHGSTDCKTPDAVAYIAKARARKKA